MTDHQERLWHRMVESIDQYTSRAITFSQLIDELEASLQAGAPWDPSLLESWYKYWQELEICRAAALNKIDPNSSGVETDVQTMRRFLSEQLGQSA